jgi:hypothetical protein
MEMNRRDFVKASSFTIAAAATAEASTKTEYQIGAYYFANFNVDPRNELIHGKGWTEWEVLKRGEPKFAGHHQPKIPVWGMEDESDPGVFQMKIAAAKAAGIGHFIFDWYWYEDAPFRNRALDFGYLHSTNKEQVKFCLMWANHDLTNHESLRLHDSRQPEPLLFRGVYDAAAFDKATDIALRYFTDPFYLKIDGAPYFSIYELKHLVDGLGGLSTAQAALKRFRDKVRAAGFPDLHLNVISFDLDGLPNLPELLPSFGVSSVTSYAWARHLEMANFPATEYDSMLQQAESYWRKAPDLFGVPYHTDVSMGWDPSPRACQTDRFEQGGYPFTPILKGNTPQKFQAALTRAKAHMDSRSDIPKVLTIYAWNEWTEGGYLEPESTYGMGYLDAIQRVFGG